MQQSSENDEFEAAREVMISQCASHDEPIAVLSREGDQGERNDRWCPGEVNCCCIGRALDSAGHGALRDMAVDDMVIEALHNELAMHLVGRNYIDVWVPFEC